MRSRNTLIVFAKSPRICRVKTRMWPRLSHRECLYFHRQSTKNLIKEVSTHPSIKLVVYLDRLDSLELIPRNTPVKRQRGRNLGIKMYHAIQQELQSSSNVVLVGSDCLELNMGYIETAFSKLHENRIVIGPANDGGYVLLGVRGNYQSLYNNIEWGTSRVLASTLQQAKRIGIQPVLLDPLIDVDNLEDLLELNKKNTLPLWASSLLSRN